VGTSPNVRSSAADFEISDALMAKMQGWASLARPFFDQAPRKL
jgi:hypothetical protein